MCFRNEECKFGGCYQRVSDAIVLMFRFKPYDYTLKFINPLLHYVGTLGLSRFCFFIVLVYVSEAGFLGTGLEYATHCLLLKPVWFSFIVSI